VTSILIHSHPFPRFLKDHPEYSAAGYGVFGFELLNHVAPGHAVVKTWALWSLFRLCTVLFGQLSSGHGEEGSARQRLVRDFPRHGDATYTHSQARHGNHFGAASVVIFCLLLEVVVK